MSETKTAEPVAQQPAGTLDADAAKAIASYRENLADKLGGRDLLRVFFIVDEGGGVGGVGCDIAEIDRKVIVGPAGGIERWAGIITDVVERLNRQPEAETLEWLMGALAPKPAADAEYHADSVAKYRRDVASKHDGREEPRIRVWLPSADSDDSGGHIVYERKLSGGFGLTEEVVHWVDAEIRDVGDKPVQVEAPPTPTPCTLDLRDAAKAPKPYDTNYDYIERYRRDESPEFAGNEMCVLSVAMEPRQDGSGDTPVHGQRICGPRGTVERLIQHVDAIAGKFAGGGAGGNGDGPTDAQPTEATPESKPAESGEPTYWSAFENDTEPNGRAAIAKHRELFPADSPKIRVCAPDNCDELYIAEWKFGGPRGLIEGFCAELDQLVRRYEVRSATAMKLATAAMGGDVEAVEPDTTDAADDDETDAEPAETAKPKPTASSKDYKAGGAHYESVSCNRGRYNIVVFDGDSDSKLDIEVMGTRREVVGGVRDLAVTLLQRRADELAEVEGGAS